WRGTGARGGDTAAAAAPPALLASRASPAAVRFGRAGAGLHAADVLRDRRLEPALAGRRPVRRPRVGVRPPRRPAAPRLPRRRRARVAAAARRPAPRRAALTRIEVRPARPGTRGSPARDEDG